MSAAFRHTNTNTHAHTQIFKYQCYHNLYRGDLLLPESVVVNYLVISGLQQIQIKVKILRKILFLMKASLNLNLKTVQMK